MVNCKFCILCIQLSLLLSSDSYIGILGQPMGLELVPLLLRMADFRGVLVLGCIPCVVKVADMGEVWES